MARGRALGPGRLAKRGRQWVVHYSDASGQRCQKALGADKRTAERLKGELIRRRDMQLEGLGAFEGQSMLLVEVAEIYLEDLRVRVSVAHFRNVSQRLSRTLLELHDQRVRDLRTVVAIRLRNEALSAGASNRTANLVTESLKAMLNWALDAGLIAQNPITRLKKLPEGRDHQRYRRRSLTDEEIHRFLDASREDDLRSGGLAQCKGLKRIPQTPVWQAALDTGARWGELRTLTWGDIDVGKRVLVLRAENTKSKRMRAIPVTRVLMEALHELRVAQQGVLHRIPTINDLVFLAPAGKAWAVHTTNAMRIFDRVLNRAGIERLDTLGQKLDIHALRHTFASRLARADVSLMHAQRLLGHSDPKLTAAIYTHLDVDDLRGAVEALDRVTEKKPRKAQSETA